MAWIDRVVEYPNRVKLTPVSGQENTYNMEASEGTVYVEGTLMNAENLNNETMNLVGEVVADGWNSSTSYAIGDSCIYNNMLWNCLTSNTNVPPTEGTYWTRVKLGNADYVVESGTDGNWTYQKWSSGKYEAVFRQDQTPSIACTTSASNGWYRSVSNTINIPSGFTSILYANVIHQAGLSFVYTSIGSANTSNVQYWLESLGSRTISTGSRMAIVIGTWK